MPTIPSPLADEPVAKRTRWAPLVSGGASFRTRGLVIVNPERVEFPASPGAKLFGGVFVALGLVGFATGIVARHRAPPLFGLAFTALGGGLLYSGTAGGIRQARGHLPTGTHHRTGSPQSDCPCPARAAR